MVATEWLFGSSWAGDKDFKNGVVIENDSMIMSGVKVMTVSRTALVNVITIHKSALHVDFRRQMGLEEYNYARSIMSAHISAAYRYGCVVRVE